MLLDKVSFFIKLPLLNDLKKIEVLDLFESLVASKLLNEAVELSCWIQSSTKEGNADSYSALFISSCVAFLEALKAVFLGKEKSGLGRIAESMYVSIRDNKFFPTSVALPLPLPLRLKLMSLDNGTVLLTQPEAEARALWQKEGWATLLVDYEILGGFYKVAFEVECGSNTSADNLGFGICTKAAFVTNNGGSAVKYDFKGACFFHHSHVYLDGVEVSTGRLYSLDKRRLIGLELDADRGTLGLWVDGLRIPHRIAYVPKAVYFVMYGYFQTLAVKLKSFQRLSSVASYPSSTEHAWK